MSLSDRLSQVFSLADVNKLSAKELNALLIQHGKSAKGTRRHKVIVACEVLGFVNEPDSLQSILNEIKQAKFGWTKDIRKCPAVTLTAVIDYLLRAHDTVTHTDSGHIERFTVDNMKRYKTLRSYKLYKAGHIHSMAFLPMGDGDRCALRGKCNPSFDTSGTVYDCMALLDKSNGQPVGSSCNCTAGQGEACTHVAALLFAMEDFTSLGLHELADDPACTEVLCAWNGPKDTNVSSWSDRNMK
jgi:hypothetical protein